MAFLRFFNDKNRYLAPFSSCKWLENQKDFKPFLQQSQHTISTSSNFSLHFRLLKKRFFSGCAQILVHYLYVPSFGLSLSRAWFKSDFILYLFSYIFLNYNPQQRQMQCKWESEFSWDTRVSELSKLSNLTEHSWGCITTGNAVGKIYFWSRGRPPQFQNTFFNTEII